MISRDDLTGDIVELVPFAPSPVAPPLAEVSFRHDGWTSVQLGELRRLFAADVPLEQIGEAVGRSRQAVSTKIWELGLRRNSKRPWNELEDAFLIEHYRSIPGSRIAQALGRGASSTFLRAQYLGLSEPGPLDWDEWEDAQLRAGYDRAVPLAQLAMLIGRPIGGVIARAMLLGLRHPAKRLDWSDQELARLLELAEQGHRYKAVIDLLAAEGFPRRTKAGVQPQLYAMGYHRGWGRPWSAEEDDLLRRFYAEGRSLTPLRARCGRTRESISYRAEVLGLNGTHRLKAGWRTGPNWTADQEQRLRELYGTMPTRDLVPILGRELRAIYVRANHLGLSHPFMRAFTPDEDRAIEAAWANAVSLSDTARALGRDTAVVGKRARRIGKSFADPARPNGKGSRAIGASRPNLSLAELLAMA